MIVFTNARWYSHTHAIILTSKTVLMGITELGSAVYDLRAEL